MNHLQNKRAREIQRFFRHIPASELWTIVKPFIWIEDFFFFVVQGHDATEHRVNTKCVPPSMAFYVSLFDIFYPKSTQWPEPYEHEGCQVKGLSAAVQRYSDTRQRCALGRSFRLSLMLLLSPWRKDFTANKTFLAFFFKCGKNSVQREGGCVQRKVGAGEWTVLMRRRKN